MDFGEIVLESAKVFDEGFVGTDNRSFFLCQSPSFLIAHSVFLHEEGNNKGGRAAHSHLAVHKHVMFFQIIFDVAVSFFQMRVNVLVFQILKINPLMLSDVILSHPFLHIVVFKGPLIDDAQNTIDAMFGFDGFFQCRYP